MDAKNQQDRAKMVDKLLEECHRIFDDKSGRNEMLAQKASKLFEEE